MNIHFLFGGGSWDTDAAPLGNDYLNRITRTDKATLHLVESKEKDADRRRIDESAKILKSIDVRDFVIVFDERGTSTSSEKYSQMLERVEENSMRAVCIVGGAYGMTDDVRARANTTIALSPMIFPHDLARIMVLEQTYRARQIAHGSKYHHA